MSPGHDPAQRATAAEISRASPFWVIMWGPWSRMYFAFPLFNAPPGAMLAAPGPSELLAAMRGAELAAGYPPRPRQPPAK